MRLVNMHYQADVCIVKPGAKSRYCYKIRLVGASKPGPKQLLLLFSHASNSRIERAAE
jgi:hypothetical protein